MNLSQSIGAQLRQKISGDWSSTEPAAKGLTPQQAAQAAARAGKEPILQLNRFPITLDPTDYADPFSNSRPNGDMRTLYAFTQLVDPIPTFTRFYSISGSSTSSIYDIVVKGLQVDGSSPFTAAMVSDARRKMSGGGLQNLDSTPGRWYPVYATPYDWYDLSQQERYLPIQIDLTTSGSGAGFATIGTEDDDGDAFSWRFRGPEAKSGAASPETKAHLDSATQLQTLSFRGMKVELTRNWMHYELFKTAGWSLSGQRKGFISEGRLTSNDGIMPLLLLNLIVGFDLELKADWASADRDLIHQAADRGSTLDLGLMRFDFAQQGTTFDEKTLKSPVLQVVGWLSDLVPLAPAG